ncbi:RagB/SusD family nutrient uptake outer membrane protein [Compostibacter hankyongensis]|uniref:RagB/SusD family nutrient uptake outer membrane protein n=1 Tax=Compostibacter hankyongensis TaxID=1007089 RepID=A0ABP8G2Q4_9BACT
MKLISFLLLCLLVMGLTACKKDFLDKTPDGDLTSDQVFTNPTYAEQYLTNIYTHLPRELSLVDNPGAGESPSNVFTAASDEMEMSYDPNFANNINAGNWSPTSYVQDIWSQCYIGIRKANLFLENIGKLPVSSLAPESKIRRWRGEAIFLRAFYHFLLVRVYGPVPVIDKTISLDADYLAYRRMPIDQCVDFIAAQCDSAALLLDPRITAANDYGRPDKTTALALKARVLLYMASPLWNGGTTLKDKDGLDLFPAPDASRWQTAADAARACIDQAESVGHKLYRSATNDPELNYAEIFYNNFNDEVFFTRDDPGYNNIDAYSEPRGMAGAFWPLQSPTQDMVDAYEMADGTRPILGYNADMTPVINPLSGYRETGQAAVETKDYVAGTRNMYVGREPRFYASIMFTGQKYKWSAPQNRTTPLEFWKLGLDGRPIASGDNYSKTGYLLKKLTNPAFVMSPKADPIRVWIFFRLGEQYLNYAEALNEAQGPVADVYKYVNLIRDRAGLPGLPPGLSKDAMRDAIHHERRIELAFETHRYFDTRRWMTAASIDDKNIYGLDVNGVVSADPLVPYNITSDAFYKRTVLEKRVFDTKDYYWPVPQREIEKNPKLVQNPGW